jgi:hypothetical protein
MPGAHAILGSNPSGPINGFEPDWVWNLFCYRSVKLQKFMGWIEPGRDLNRFWFESN